MKTTIEKIAVMQAYQDGKKIKQVDRKCSLNFIDICKKETEGIEWLEVDWDWVNYDYKIVEEPKQIPFDFSDAESLINRVFKHKNSGFPAVCTWVDDAILYLGPSEIDYKTLAKNWLIKNETLNEWLPCTKTVNN